MNEIDVHRRLVLLRSGDLGATDHGIRVTLDRLTQRMVRIGLGGVDLEPFLVMVNVPLHAIVMMGCGHHMGMERIVAMAMDQQAATRAHVEEEGRQAGEEHQHGDALPPSRQNA